MQSKAPTVDAYLDTLPDERREIAVAIRTMVNRAAPRCRESMAYGMPGWDLGGHWIALGWQRHCLALFVSDPDLVRDLALAAGSKDFGMSCMRWPSARHVRLEGLRALIEAAAKRRISLMAANAKLATAAAAAERRAEAKRVAAKPRPAVRTAARKSAARKTAARKTAAHARAPRGAGSTRPAAKRSGGASRPRPKSARSSSR